MGKKIEKKLRQQLAIENLVKTKKQAKVSMENATQEFEWHQRQLSRVKERMKRHSGAILRKGRQLSVLLKEIRGI